ncbi:unnamed protein product, partial [Polarella glacialis]
RRCHRHRSVASLASALVLAAGAARSAELLAARGPAADSLAWLPLPWSRGDQLQASSSLSEEPWPRRRALLGQATLSIAVASQGAEGARAEEAKDAYVLRTLKEIPEIPKVLAIMLLRTTYDSASDWGCFKADMIDYQRSFSLQLRDGYQSFRGRYQNYDLSALYNTTQLLQSRSGGVTNRFYFSFLNDAQWRVIAKSIRRPGDRLRFVQVLELKRIL